MDSELIEREVLRLVIIHDDGEHEPHEVEQCGIFLSDNHIRAYVDKRFNASMLSHLKAIGRGEAENLTWQLEFPDGKDANLVVIVWRESLFAPAPGIADNQRIAELEASLRDAMKQCSEWARQAGEAKGRLEMSEAAGIVDGWREKCEGLEAEVARLVQVLAEAELRGIKLMQEAAAKVAKAWTGGRPDMASSAAKVILKNISALDPAAVQRGE